MRNHIITFPTSGTAKALPVVDASLLSGITGAGKTITFVGATGVTIGSLTLAAATATAVEIKFVVPATKVLTISAITGNTMTCTGTTVGGTAAAPTLTAGAGATTFTCTTGGVTGGVSAPIFSTKEKAAVFSEEVK